MPALEQPNSAPAECTKPVGSVSAEDFARPSQLCDIVMKGGVTSGVVYPAAILRVAQRFRLKNICGTSAGAIAAAVAAAVEFRRASSGSGLGFVKLKTQIMDWLAEDRNLQSLFVPVRAAGPLYYALIWLIGVMAALRQFQSPIGALLKRAASLCLAALVVVGLAQAILRFTLPVVGTLPQLVFAIAFLATAIAAFWILYILPRSNFGMCTGGVADRVPGRAQPLTFWLAEQIDDIAGTAPGRPLTFGDLWCGHIRTEADLEQAGPSNPIINLQMVTTSLTMGRPFSLPFTANIFYFRPDEFARFFPDYIVKWMERCARGPNPNDAYSSQRHKYLKELGYLPLPGAANLPIIVAARLSLSFPMLLSAIRLYAIDHTLEYNQSFPATPQIEPVWFSDGGLSSNFPVSFFDSPIPRWPTLGITLEEFPPGIEPTMQNGAYVPESNQSEIGSIWTRFSPSAVPSNTPGFYGAIINCMQNWQDTMQSEAPGFRDRIAHIRLAPQEGGLNLAMPTSVIKTLLARGELAGELLVQHFQIPIPNPPPTIMTWDNHRWVRLRTTLDVLGRYAAAFSDGWNAAGSAPSYAALVAAGVTNPHYKFQPPQVASALALAKDLNDIAAVTAAESASLSSGAPHPASDLHARPRY